MGKVNSAHGEEHWVSNTLQEATATLEPDPSPALGLIQASQMTSLVSDNLMGASSSFSTPPQ